jgi:hypothetical protein
MPGDRQTTRNQRMTERKHIRLQQMWQEVLTYSFILVPVGFLACALAFTVFMAKMEADAFNKLTTGPKVTIMDALFLDLRVEAK